MNKLNILFSFLLSIIIVFTLGSNLDGIDISESRKLDLVACDSDVNGTICHRTREIEKHFHVNKGTRWFGISASQAGTDWNESSSDAGMPDVFTAISGAAAFGADANDEAKVIGTGDTCGGIAGMTKFDLHKIEITDTSSTTLYVVRIVHGSDTLANNITAGNYSEFHFKRDTAVNEAHGVPIPIDMPRLTWGTDKVWIQVKNATDNATVEFYPGLHCYVN